MIKFAIGWHDVVASSKEIGDGCSVGLVTDFILSIFTEVYWTAFTLAPATYDVISPNKKRDTNLMLHSYKIPRKCGSVMMDMICTSK